MSVSGVFILDERGKLLISRNYRDDVPLDYCLNRFAYFIHNFDAAKLLPIMEENEITYTHVRINNLYFLATTIYNANATMMFSFLYEIQRVLEAYFTTILEESIMDNIVLIHELLDEMMDFGEPQTTNLTDLHEVISQEAAKFTPEYRPPIMHSGIMHRPEQIIYAKNELFIKVVERVNCLMSPAGEVLQQTISGVILAEARLSGVPEVMMGFSHLSFPSEFSIKPDSDFISIAAHHSVRFRNDPNRIALIPPDGAFELLQYSVQKDIQPLFKISSQIIKHSHSRISYRITVVGDFPKEFVAKNVIINIPVPADADSPHMLTKNGNVSYSPHLEAMVWKINKFVGRSFSHLEAHFGLSSIDSEEKVDVPPIQVEFSIPNFVASGMKIEYVKIYERRNYDSRTWIQYMTHSGDFQSRIHMHSP